MNYYYVLELTPVLIQPWAVKSLYIRVSVTKQGIGFLMLDSNYMLLAIRMLFKLQLPSPFAVTEIKSHFQ